MRKRTFFVLPNIIIFGVAAVQSQNFNKYYTWASEKHMDPGDSTERLFFIAY